MGDEGRCLKELRVLGGRFCVAAAAAAAAAAGGGGGGGGGRGANHRLSAKTKRKPVKRNFTKSCTTSLELDN